MEKVSGLGYSVSPSFDESEVSGERRDLLMRLCISSVLTVNVMMIACALYFGFFEDLGDEGVRTLSWLLWLLATPVVFHGGGPILNKAMAGARRGNASMETLIAIGSVTAYFYSTCQTIMGSLHVYFDTATMLVTLVLLGKFIESGARQRVSRQVTELLRAAGEKVRLLDGGREKWASSGQVGLGQEFLIRAGERVVMDGEILEGMADVDESFLTGESRPVRKRIRGEILSGSVVLNGELRARATRLDHQTMLRQMISVIQDSLAAKVPAEQMADAVIRWIVPVVIALALVTAVGVTVAGSALEEAVRRGLTVLVITCPCALGIAVPLAKVATISLARACGLIIRDPGALERIHSLDAFVFDKTGTVTEGSFGLRRILAPRARETDVLRRLGAVEARSDHLIAREILRKCGEAGIDLPECTAFEAYDGMGVLGSAGVEQIGIGNRRFMAERGHAIPSEMEMEASRFELQGMTTAFFSWDDSVQGVLILGDDIRAGSRETLEALHASGAGLWMISGDAPQTTGAISSSLPLNGFVGGMLPPEKADFVMKLRREGFRVGVVGDGINDAPALAAADVAFTVGNGADLLREVSSVTLSQRSIGGLLDAVALSKLHARISVQNLFFAFAYNALAIPIAVAGLLNPIIAVVAMFLSSLTVVANTLRIPRSTLCGGRI
jgi:heavy metal translocating P-type ATPase